MRVRHGALHVGDVLGRDDRPALDLLPCFVVDEPDLDRVPTNLKGVDPDDRARDAVAHVGVHALDHGHYRDEEPDRHDDPEQREERTELVAPRGLEGLENCFGEGHGGKLIADWRFRIADWGRLVQSAIRNPQSAFRNYSYLSASTGSSRAARLAGYSPNPTPVRADAPSAATMDHSGTWAGIGVSRETPKASRPPTSIPTAPPTRVRVEASTRNCHRIARRVAPSALRTPISRVRSVTEIIMIATTPTRSEEHTSELQSQSNLVCRLLLEKKKNRQHNNN